MVDIEEIKIYVEYSIIGLLVFMSFLTIWFGLERFFYLSNIDINEFKKRGEIERAVSNNITIISIVASNSPYIGLLGTVCGIMITFYKISQNSTLDTNSIMLGLALALKATAVGIVVALIATIIYNILIRKIEVIISLWEDLNEIQKV